MGSNVSRETYGGNNDFDVIVIGGGHAGIEASSATARMGMQTALITMDPEKIGLMSCNPAIGGLAKGQLVREIDALGGEMGRIIDATGIHFKMLNTSKGPAVWSPRAQADRKQYAVTAGERLLRLKNMVIIKGQVNRLIIEHDTIRGVGLENDDEITASIVIVTYIPDGRGKNQRQESPNHWSNTVLNQTGLKPVHHPDCTATASIFPGLKFRNPITPPNHFLLQPGS